MSNLVGRMSRGQVESEMDNMIALTSVSVVRAKFDKRWRVRVRRNIVWLQSSGKFIDFVTEEG